MASLGLLMISLTISTILGVLMGLLAVRNQSRGYVSGLPHYLRLDWQYAVFSSVGSAFRPGNLQEGELEKHYIIVVQFWPCQPERWEHQALRNIIAAIIFTIARTFRMLVEELVVVEWLFKWPDPGRYRLQPGTGGAETQPAMFLDPPTSC